MANTHIQNADKRKGTVPERKQTMGVTSIYSGVASAVRNRFVGTHRLVKEFFFIHKQ